MVDAFQDAAAFLSPAEFKGGPTKDDLRNKLGESLSGFLEYYRHHKIFFSSEVVASIDALVKSVHRPSLGFSIYLTATKDNDLAKGKMVDAWIKASDDFDELAAPALEAVEDQFRTLLGVTQPIAEIVSHQSKDGAK